jgi:hypothetical protein
MTTLVAIFKTSFAYDVLAEVYPISLTNQSRKIVLLMLLTLHGFDQLPRPTDFYLLLSQPHASSTKASNYNDEMKLRWQ